MNSRTTRAALLTAFTMLAATASAEANGASGVRCGQELHNSIRLERNLRGCPAAGLVVGASHITIDLNGHALEGASGATVGIDNSAGHDHVAVQAGTVRGFDVGVLLDRDAVRNRVHRLRISAGGAGIAAIDSRRNAIERTTVSSLGSAIFLFGSSHNRIDRNVVEDAGFIGIQVDGASSHNHVRRNHVVRTADVGIALEVHDDDPSAPPTHPTENVIAHNTLAANAFGILLVEAHRNAIVGNSVDGAGTFGDPGSPGGGLGLDGASDNLVARNAVTGSRGRGIQVGGDPGEQPERPAAAGNLLEANVVRESGLDGVHLSALTRDNTLVRNRADHNGADGIHVLSRFTRLFANVARGNALLGIEAVIGVTDGGNNIADGNGNPTQCVGVSCG